MSGFLDTNILIYAADRSAPIPRKTKIARELLLQDDLYLSVQVLNEFTVNARHPKKQNLSFEEELRGIECWLRLQPQPLTAHTFLRARYFQAQYKMSHWDGMILAAAEACGCTRLYSEDLSPGQSYETIEVINPFVESGASAFCD